MKSRIVSLVALAALAGAAHAQGFRMMRPTSGSKTSMVMLLGREDVQAELKLDDDQKGKLDAQRAGARDKFRQAFTEMRSAGEGGEDAQKTIQTKMMALFEDMAKDALAILTEPQKKRLQELYVQSSGPLAVTQPDLAKEIGLTEAQKAKIDDLERMQGEATQNLWEQVNNQEIDRDEAMERMQKNSKIMETEVGKVLTPAQRDKLKVLGGAPFEFKDPKPGTPGSFGRPGGGR